MSANSIVVVGGGAAGLWAALTAARGGAQVLVLEKTERTGTKVLASGGTRCNLTTTLGPDEAARLFGRRGGRFLQCAFQNLPPLEVRRRFAEWGVETIETELDKVFPSSGRARDVRDALEHAARAAGAEIRLSSGVTGVRRDGDAWSIERASEPPLTCARVVLASGGQSFPRTGTTGEGYAWLRELGLVVHDTVPALVPLRCNDAWVHDLAGIAWQTGEARLSIDQKIIATRRRPLLFTHRGVSGPAAMDLSVHVARAGADAADGRIELALVFFPELDRDALRATCLAAASASGAPRLRSILPQPIPRRLFHALLRQAAIADDDPRMSRLTKAERHRWIEALKGLLLTIHGTEGFDKAEVTAGGLDLKQVDPRSMQVNGHAGLYVIGELLDLDGPIGGLNFQAAFACAELAGAHAAGR